MKRFFNSLKIVALFILIFLFGEKLRAYGHPESEIYDSVVYVLDTISNQQYANELFIVKVSNGRSICNLTEYLYLLGDNIKILTNSEGSIVLVEGENFSKGWVIVSFYNNDPVVIKTLSIFEICEWQEDDYLVFFEEIKKGEDNKFYLKKNVYQNGVIFELSYFSTIDECIKNCTYNLFLTHNPE